MAPNADILLLGNPVHLHTLGHADRQILHVEVEGFALLVVPGPRHPVGGTAGVVAARLLLDLLQHEVGARAVHDDPLALVLLERPPVVEPLDHPVDGGVAHDLADEEDVVALGDGLLAEHGGELERDARREVHVECPGLAQHGAARAQLPQLGVLRAAGEGLVGVLLPRRDGEAAGARAAVQRRGREDLP